MSPAARRTALLLLTVIYGFGFIDRIVIALVAQDIKADFGISDFQIGLLGGTAFAVVNTFAALPLAWLADRYPRKWIAGGSLLLASIFTGIFGFASNFFHMVLARLGMAGGSAGTEAPPHSMISDMYPPEKRASAMSLFMLGVPIAAFIGSAAGGTVAAAYGWRATFYVIGGMGMIVSFISFLFIREPARGEVAAKATPQSEALSENNPGIKTVFKVMVGDRCMRHILLGVSIISLGAFGMNTFLPAFFSRNYGLGVGEAGTLFGLLTGIASAVGTIAGGYGSEWLARRDPRWLIAVPGLGAVIGAPIFITGLMQNSLPLAFGLMLTGSLFFYMAMGPAIAALHALLDSRSRATGSAIFLLIMHLTGQGLGPPIAGIVSDAISAWSYGGGNFSTVCAGAAGQVPGSDCASAAATGIRYAIACFGAFYIWSGLHMLWAARWRRTETALAN
ncbi:spinster family MFS transporter [Altericroceibacterium endophyticum]|uniref:MFS transporter n=1 Tax=Altericroceibacterium endophyticum TaxID=1808508 RepID=A0A6I4T861_9SPHN|nr:MFS transporter [Altericroceibacterium endophyticum]MXO66442.1 MFS transporter [Altericroceibacterium endophyticum]